MKTFDCVIVGGGMIGAACALSLAHQGLTVAIIEKNPPKPIDKTEPFDLRVSAISVASQYLLEQLGAWQAISRERLCPYTRLGVWESELCYAEFNANELNEPQLGHIVENRLIQLSLWEQIVKQEKIQLYCPDSLRAIEMEVDHVLVELSSNTIKAKILVGADGANSHVRKLANIGITGWDYEQSAMLINVETSLKQQNITWQQYQETGPVAFLPLSGKSKKGGYASLVWYHQKEEIKRLSQLSHEQLRNAILENFPERLGDIDVINKGAFPLTRRHANHYQNNRIVLIGDAAHTINPMAGQGVNLGFKDVKALERVIASAIGENRDWSNPLTLKNYEKMRRADNLMMMSGMDFLYQGFKHKSPLVKSLRNLGIFMINKVPTLKKKALAYACGI